ncbi:MAG TPA: hypothetical protein VGA99_08690 [bacterium]
MTNSGKPPKDLWDKLDVLGKMVSGIVLVVIAVVLERGSSRIAQSMQSGQLVQSLISDLAVPDTTIKQDIALIALNHSVGEQNPNLVLQICERILANTKDYDDLTGKVAFDIIRSRAPRRAKEIEDSARNIAQREQSTLRSAAVPNKEPPVQSSPAKISSSKFVARVLPNVVYIQFKNSAYRDQIARLQNDLNNEGVVAPGIEQVDADYGNSIRYFHDQDRDLAERVHKIADGFFQDEGVYWHVEIQDLSDAKMSENTSPGRVEVWINLDRN